MSIKDLSHNWQPAPHYADVDWYSRKEMRMYQWCNYWWCNFCEEHRFQQERPPQELCQSKVDQKLYDMRSITDEACMELASIGGQHDGQNTISQTSPSDTES